MTFFTIPKQLIRSKNKRMIPSRPNIREARDLLAIKPKILKPTVTSIRYFSVLDLQIKK